MSEFQHSVKVPRLYKNACRILKSVHEGGSLKDLVYNHNRFANIKALHALVAESIKYDKLLSRVLQSTNILNSERFDPWLAKVLLTELIFGKKKLPGNSKPILTILKYKEDIDRHLNEADFHNISLYSRQNKKASKPRYVRVNTLKISLEDAISKFKDEGWEELECPSSYNEYLLLIQDRMFNEDYIFIQDFHVKNLLVFPSTSQFYDHPAYLGKSVILQDKASCLLTCCVSIKPGSVILDMCAGPGMKTALLAACINNQGKIHAVEIGVNRFNIMKVLLNSFGVDCVEARNCDAGSVGPNICKDVKYILVDPSCSGTGMTSRVEDAEVEFCKKLRLQKLANIQGFLLRHAVSNFPTAKYVFYFTCSLEEEENEMVVESVLGCAKLHGFSLMNLKKKFKGWINFGSDKYECGQKCIYTRPENDFTNGGFLAVFKRKSKCFTIDATNVTKEFIELINPDEEKKTLPEQLFTVVNTLKISVDDAIQLFVDNGWKHLPSPSNYNIFLSGLQEDKKRIQEKFFEQDFHVKELLVFPMGVVDDLSENFISERKFILLDKVSCLAVHLLDPVAGSKVLDICAGTERMSLYMASQMKNIGSVFAYESNYYLYRELLNELQKCCITCVKVKHDSGFYSSSKECSDVKLILVNPPCSGSGSGLTEKTHYSLIKNTSNLNKEYVLRKYVVTQFSLLRLAFIEFPEVYRIVYVTRSIHPEENEDIINALLVLAKFNGFKLIDASKRIDGWKNECNTKYVWGTKCLIARDELSITKGCFIAVFERNFKNNNLVLSEDSRIKDTSPFDADKKNINRDETASEKFVSDDQRDGDSSHLLDMEGNPKNKDGNEIVEVLKSDKNDINESFYDQMTKSIHEFMESDETTEEIIKEPSESSENILIGSNFIDVNSKKSKKHKRKNAYKEQLNIKNVSLEKNKKLKDCIGMLEEEYCGNKKNGLNKKKVNKTSKELFTHSYFESHDKTPDDSVINVKHKNSEKRKKKKTTNNENFVEGGEVIETNQSKEYTGLERELENNNYVELMESSKVYKSNKKRKKYDKNVSLDNIIDENIKTKRKSKKCRKDNIDGEIVTDRYEHNTIKCGTITVGCGLNSHEMEIIENKTEMPTAVEDTDVGVVATTHIKKKRKKDFKNLDLEVIFSVKSKKCKVKKKYDEDTKEINNVFNDSFPESVACNENENFEDSLSSGMNSNLSKRIFNDPSFHVIDHMKRKKKKKKKEKEL